MMIDAETQPSDEGLYFIAGLLVITVVLFVMGFIYN